MSDEPNTATIEAPNARMRERWDDRAMQYLANDAIFSGVSRPLAEAVLAAVEPLAGRSVLDIGCGAGGLSRMIADAGGAPVGVDISTTMISGARHRHPDLRFELADAQTAELAAFAPTGGFDHVVSKFGVMFFADPRAAFANLRRACVPSGTMSFVCWRALAENPMFTLGVDVLIDRMDEPPPPIQPGPDAFADADQLREHLLGAGWSEVRITPLEILMRYGVRGGDGVEERLTIALTGAAGEAAERELRPKLGERGWAELVEEVRTAIRASMIDGEVAFPARTWLVHAVNPAS